jgi:hypothetical protein
MWQPVAGMKNLLKLNGMIADSSVSRHESFADLPRRCVGPVFQG